MTDAERQARCRAARIAGKPAIRMRRPADHRSRARRWRDAVAERDDASQVDWLANQRCELVRGEATVAHPGLVRAGERELTYDRLVIATGSSPDIPSIRGLDEVDAVLDDVRQRIDAASLLFKVRVLGDELRERELSAPPPAAPHARTVTSQVS